MISECPHCQDNEGLGLQLNEDFICPECGEDFSEEI